MASAVGLGLNKQNSSVIINRLGGVVTAADGSIQCHDRCHGTVDFLCGFLLVRLDVPSRVGADEDVVHHPAEDGMPAVGDFLLQHQLHQFLGWWGHILEALSERNDREAHALKVLHHLHSAPAVKGDLPNIETLPRLSMNFSM